MTHLAVYLIHYMAPEWVESACASLADSSDVDVDITVVDNSGELETFPNVSRVLRPGSNLGYAGGANVALRDWWRRFPEDDYVIVGSHDLHVEPDTLRILLDTAQRNPKFGVLSPRLKLGGIGDRVDEESFHDLDERTWVSGTCLLLARSCLAEVGGFDEAFGSYHEDVEFCARARDTGWRVAMVPGAEATGLGSQSQLKMEMCSANDMILRLRRGGVRRFLKGFAAHLIFGAWYFLRGLAVRENRGKDWRYSRYHLYAVFHAPERLLTVLRLGSSAVPSFGEDEHDP